MHGGRDKGRTAWMYVCTLNSAYNKVTFNEKSAIMKENLHIKYTPFTYNDVALNEKPPITKQNLHIYFHYRQSWVYVLTHIDMQTECNSWQNVFQWKNTQVVIDMKEQIYLLNETICDCPLTLNRHYYWSKIYMCVQCYNSLA